MARIEVAQMAGYTDRAKESKASSDSSRTQTDFARMLKDKEQADQDDVRESKAEGGDKRQDPEEVDGKQEDTENAGQVQEKEAGAQVPAEVMLQLQAALNQLMENHGADSGRTDAGQQAALSEEIISVAETAAEIVADAAGMAALTEGEGMFKTAGKQESVQALPVSKEAAIPEDAAADQEIPADAKTVGQAVEKIPGQSGHGEEASGREEPEHGEGQARDNGQIHEARSAGESAYTHSVQTADNRTALNSASAKGQADTVTVRTTQETFPSDVGKAIAARMPGANGTLTIELEPAALGKMTIKVIYEAGRAAVSIMSANPKTLELLSQSAGDIAQILEQKTGQQTVVYTPQPQQDMDGRQGGQESGRHRQDREEEKRQSQPDSFAQQLRLGLV